MKRIITLTLTVGFLVGCSQGGSGGGNKDNTQKPQGQVDDPTNQPSPSNPTESIDHATQEKVRNALKFLLVEKYDISTTLAEQEKQAATQFSEDMMSCGLSYLGPKCLDYETLAGNYGGALSQVDGKYIFYSELKIKGAGTLVALAFKVDQIQPTVKVSAVEISKISKPRNGQAIDQYLKDSSAFSLLVTGSLATDFQAGATKRLQNPRDVRELYHVSKMLLETNMSGNNYQATRTAVANAISKNTSVITGARDVRYQEAVLSFITSEIELKRDVLVEICEGLMNSSSENIKQIAATIILNAHPSRVELKPVVLKALNNQRWDIRQRAISALSKVQKSTAEENQLVSKIGDADGDVRKEAISAASKISVNNNHLSVAKDLSGNSNWEVRVEAAKLLGRINSAESVEALIGMMSDADGDVRKQVVSLLGQKTLGEASVSGFAKQMNSSNWEVRRDAANFLGKIGSDEAVQSLISKMDDADGDVRTKIYSILAARSLTNESVANLKKNFSSQNWEVRRDVAKLLGKIKSPSSLDALEDQLIKESDSDVKTQIIASIKAVKN